MEESQARRGPAAARRAVYLAVGEDGYVSLGEARAFDVLEEDGTVDIPQPGLQGVDDLHWGVQLVLYLASYLDEAWQVGGLDREPQGARLHAGVEGSPKRDV